MGGAAAEDSNGSDVIITDAHSDGTVSDAELQAAIDALRDAVRSTPTAIAEDVTFYGGRAVTADEVAAVAHRLCERGFDPQVTTDWLESRAASRTWILSGPAGRLLTLAGGTQYCTRGPTEDETSRYQSGIASYTSANLPSLRSRQLPSSASETICEFLGTEIGGGAIEIALDKIISAASRERVDPEAVLPVVVEIAGATCDQWLPPLESAVQSRIQ